MWSKKRRKKEGKESSNIPPPGKALPEDRSQPPSHPTSPQPHNPAPPHKAQPPSQPIPVMPPSQPRNPPPRNPPPNNSQPPQRALLANPNLKPSLTVPLPSAPLTENILDSLKSSSVADGSTATLPGSTSSSSGDSLAGMANPPQVQLGTNSSTAPNPNTAQQLQKVIDAQRVQLAVTLTQLTQQLAERAVAKQQATKPKSPTPVPLGGVALQTFDYGNMSNKELEKLAAQQLEREYCKDTW